MTRAFTLAVLALAIATGCSEFEPAVGALQADSCSDTAIAPSTQVSYAADVVPIFEKHCYECHAPAPGAIGVEIGGLDLTSYQSLRAGGTVSGANIVIDGSPCESVLYQKVSPGPPFGNRMPLDGPPYLDAADLQTIHDWIAEGALDD